MASLEGQQVDDRHLKLQEAATKMSTLEPGSPALQKLNESTISLLHNRRQPVKSLGSASSTGPYRYPYVRMVGSHDFGDNLPSAESVFDSLLRAPDRRREHPNGVSSLIGSITTILYLSLCRPYRGHSDYNETSPYLDLSPLYGVDEDGEKQVRTIDGHGMLAPDCFFEDRLVFLSPEVSVLLILLNRNHNLIARRLLAANEHGDWINPSTADDRRKISQDHEIFNIARSINCIQFKNIVSEDLLKGFLGLSSTSPSANLDLNSGLKNEKGVAHDASVEFSLLHHCSALIADQGEEWMKKEFGAQISQDQAQALRASARETPDCPTYILKLNEGDELGHEVLNRGDDGRFNDGDLAKILLNATDTIARAPEARAIPSCMRTINTMIMSQARSWQVCTLNEFRAYLGLKPFKTFEQWNSNPEIVRAARTLYGTVENLELYPGLQAEDVMPGSGLRLGFTQTYGLLVDIVTSIRSDPRFTTDFTPLKLTQWGFKECSSKTNNGAFGAMLPNLLLRNLPRHYTYNNIYGLFPLTVPIKAKEELIGKFPNLYDFERPKVPDIITLGTREAISYVLNKPDTFQTTYGSDLKYLTKGYGYMLGFDDEKLHDADQIMTLYALMPDTRSFAEYASIFGDMAEDLIKEKSKSDNNGKSIDIIQDVINPTCTRWACQTICHLDVKPGNGEMEKQFQQFAVLYAFVFRKFEPGDGWAARESALAASEILNTHIEERLRNILHYYQESYLQYFVRIYKEFTGGLDLGKPSVHTFMERLAKTNHTIGTFRHIVGFDEFKNLMSSPPNTEEKERLSILRVTANVLGLSVVFATNYAQACSHAVNFYLDDKYAQEREEIIKLVQKADPKDDELIMGYIREAQRLGQPFGLFRQVKEDSSIPSGPDVKKGNLVFADFGQMHVNPVDYPNPDKVDPRRKTYSIQGMGLHKCPGLSLVNHTMPELFRVIFDLQHLRRVDGRVGQIATFSPYHQQLNSDPRLFIDATGETTPYPKSMVVKYDNSGPKALRKRWTVPVAQYSNKKKAADAGGLISLLITIWLAIFGNRSMPPPPTDTISQGSGSMALQGSSSIACNAPTTIFQRWDVNTIVPGLDGQPSPIEYTLEHQKPHRLSVVDIDERDMQLEVFVDGVTHGLTTDFDLDQSVNCGEDVMVCLKQNFSTGVFVVPPGKHTVKIVWVGKDYLAGTNDIYWGDEYSRRLKWQLEYCH